MFTAAGGASDQEVHYFDDTEVLTIFRGGSLSWRTQNPGLLGLGMAALDNGSIGIAQGLPVFPSLEQGRRALKAWLGGQETAHLTLAGLYRRIDPDWTLPETSTPDGGRTSRCPRTGLGGDVLLGRLNPGDIRAIADAVEAHIGLIPGTILTRPLSSGEPESGHAGGDSPRTSGNRNIAINGRSAVHAGSEGILTTIDVCRTRIGKKCKPIPYMNVAESMDAVGTAGSILINGHPACHLDSRFSRSRGDEAGHCGGLRSGTRQGHAEFLTASGNVFFEGRPAVRQFDQMVSNCRNTPPAPLMQPGCAPPPEIDLEILQAPPVEESPYALRLDIDLDRAEGKGLLMELTTQGSTQRHMEAYPEPEPGHRGHHRMIFTGLEEAPVDLALRLDDPFHGIYRVPLASGVMPRKRNLAGDPELRVHRHHHQFAAIVLHRALDLDQRETAPIRPGCRVYLFRDGHLWRELEAGPEGSWFEVNLTQWQGQDERPAHCPLGARILLPHYVAGHLHEYHLAMSEIPWHWERIEGFGGMAWGDLRSQKTPEKKARKHHTNIETRCQFIYLGSDNVRTGRIGQNGNSGGRSRHHLRPQANQENTLNIKEINGEITIIINDAIQMARELKRSLEKQQNTLYQANKSAIQGEIALGRLIRGIAKSEPKINKLISNRKIRETETEWKIITKKAVFKIKEINNKATKVIQSNDFRNALEDYYHSPEPETRAIGILNWINCIKNIEIEKIADYLSPFIQGINCQTNYFSGRDDEVRRTLEDWFTGEKSLKPNHPNMRSISKPDITDLTTLATSAIENIIQTLADAAYSQGASNSETKKIASMINRISGIEVNTKSDSIYAILAPALNSKENTETYTYQMKEIREFKTWSQSKTITYLLPKGALSIADISDIIRKDAAYRTAFGAIIGPILTINAYIAFSNIAKEKSLSNQAALAASISALTSALTGELEFWIYRKESKTTPRSIRYLNSISTHTANAANITLGSIHLYHAAIEKNAYRALGGSLIILGTLSLLLPFGAPQLAILASLAITATGSYIAETATRSKIEEAIFNSWFGKRGAHHPHTPSNKSVDLPKEIHNIISLLHTISAEVTTYRIIYPKKTTERKHYTPEDPVLIKIRVIFGIPLPPGSKITGHIELRSPTEIVPIQKMAANEITHKKHLKEIEFYLKTRVKRITHGTPLKISTTLTSFSKTKNFKTTSTTTGKRKRNGTINEDEWLKILKNAQPIQNQ